MEYARRHSDLDEAQAVDTTWLGTILLSDPGSDCRESHSRGAYADSRESGSMEYKATGCLHNESSIREERTLQSVS